MNRLYLILLLTISITVHAECEVWEPDFKFKIKDASFRETMTWLSGWSFALEYIAKDNPTIKLCPPECGYSASKTMSEILNKNYAEQTITAELAAETIWPNIKDIYKCDLHSKAFMNDVNLSDEAVHEMNKQELWKIGVEYLSWPVEIDEELTKGMIHQKLLDAKYSNVGDMHDSAIIIKEALKNE